MFAFSETFAAVSALFAGGLLMAHVKSKSSAGLLHHATHGRMSADARLNRLIGEFIGVLSLSIPFDEYRRIHGKHHSFTTFARPDLDEEAEWLMNQGFLPGRSRQELRRLFWRKIFSPVWHAEQAYGRLKQNFFGGATWRTGGAWMAWGGGGMLAASAEAIPAFLGVIGALLVAGSIGSYLELTSRHIWGVLTNSTGRERQQELSHWRLPAPWLPSRWTFGNAVRFAGSVTLKALWRIAATPLDLPHHPAHHLAWDATSQAGIPAWTDAAQAHSDRLRADPALQAYMHGSLIEALEAWFEALEKMPPSAAARRPTMPTSSP